MDRNASDWDSHWPEHAWNRFAEALGLTGAEIGVAQRLADGKSDKEIAQALGISRSTVHAHLANLYRKAGVGSRGELVALAFRYLVPPSDE